MASGGQFQRDCARGILVEAPGPTARIWLVPVVALSSTPSSAPLARHARHRCRPAQSAFSEPAIGRFCRRLFLESALMLLDSLQLPERSTLRAAIDAATRRAEPV